MIRPDDVHGLEGSTARGWGEAARFRPQPWDASDTAERGRERYAIEHGGH